MSLVRQVDITRLENQPRRGGGIMNERPILMTPENAQKCFDGTKTQTRRIVKPQPTVNEYGYFRWTPRSEGHNGIYTPDSFLAECPYGQVGDRLWVREKWEAGYYQSGTGPVLIAAFQNINTFSLYKKPPGETRDIEDWCLCWKVKPAIHMPRWACRTVLEITEIRVERVQSISEEDAKSEGASFHDGRGIGHSGWRHDFKDVYTDARSSFRALWSSINGPTSWEENPYVWVIGFKKVAA